MSVFEKQTLIVGKGKDARQIAYRTRMAQNADGPGLLWLSGYKSSMVGEKALVTDAFAEKCGLSCTRFDYSGHGESGGTFVDGSISMWLEEALAIFNEKTEGDQILLGSSMGGWLCLLLTLAHLKAFGQEKSRIKGLILVAPAVDMTKVLMWDRFDEAVKEETKREGVFFRNSEEEGNYQITWKLIEDGEKHLLGDKPIETGCPVHILQGTYDESVPWQMSVDLVARLARDDVRLTLVKTGDHALSRAEDLALLTRSIETMIDNVRA